MRSWGVTISLRGTKFLRDLSIFIFLWAFIFVEKSFAQDLDSAKLQDLFSLDLEEFTNIRVSSASIFDEPLIESPVAVTIITREMIQNCGSINLKEVLLTYVPGLTLVEDPDDPNISMRGVFGTNQQKILFLLNGHRINNRAVNSAWPEFSHNLDKIDRIEVIRGPASSLYGDVALTAVVQIITRSGSELDELMIQGRMGNYGQNNISILYGKGEKNLWDFLFWGHYYKADGEKVYIPAEKDHSLYPQEGYSIVGGVKDIPALDAGFRYFNKSVDIMACFRGSHRVAPFSTTGQTGEVFSYKDYRTFQGMGPGTGIKSGHLDVKWNIPSSGRFIHKVRFFADHNILISNHIFNPSQQEFKMLEYDSYAFGLDYNFIRNYTSRLGNGTFVGGTKGERMKLYDSFQLFGRGGEFISVEDCTDLMYVRKGSENSYSVYSELKHKFSEKWILNLGMRYDYKTRVSGKYVDAISPRVALVYIYSPKFNLKFSSARSFVDAAYFYRNNHITDFQGSSSLMPEFLWSHQITPSFILFKEKVRYSITTFYNHIRDVVIRDPLATPGAGKPLYINAGELESTGIEQEFHAQNRNVNLYLNATWQYALSSQDYRIHEHHIGNVPSFTANMAIHYSPSFFFNNKLSVNYSLRYLGEQHSFINTYQNGISLYIPDLIVNPVFLSNAGMSYRLTDFFEFEIQIRNLFDTYYEQGGSTKFPYPQEGRWFLVSGRLHFKNR